MSAPTGTVKPKKTGRVARGISTNDLIFSACQDTNDAVFPHILKLYVPAGSLVADVTFGRGVFWKQVPKGAYELRATDLRTGVDCGKLPYGNTTIDCVVFDPPYMHTPGGTAHQNHQNFEAYYSNNGIENSSKKYHEAVLDLYLWRSSTNWARWGSWWKTCLWLCAGTSPASAAFSGRSTPGRTTPTSSFSARLSQQGISLREEMAKWPYA
jgi:hypothetical protein